MLTPIASPICIFLLGRFEVAWGERTLCATDWPRRKAAALLQRLALERRLIKDQAIDSLWPDADLISGANNLYRTLHALRQRLDGGLGPGAANATFSFEDGVLTLETSVWVDAHEFERLCAASLIAPVEQRVAHLRQALDLYQGDLLPDDLYAEWTLVPRDALRRRYREASLALAAHARNSRDYNAAISLLTPLLARDPADEPVHRELMRTHALAGHRHEALRQYHICRDALARELDVPPEPETSALYAQILNGELTPLSTPMTARILPTPLAREIEHSPALVGREVEFATLRAWINSAQQGKGKTVLLVGEAGVGKTLLAGEALCAATGMGVTPLFGAAYEQEGQLSYQPFIEAFDRHLAAHSRPADENPITHFKRIGSSDPQQEQFALLQSVAAFLSDLPAPVVLFIDDLHAADEASWRLFHYLARQTRSAPFTLLATYRAEALATTTPFAALISALYRERLSETLTLSPLSEDATAQVLVQVLNDDVAPDLVAVVQDMTEGNPFYVQEIARTLIKTNQVEQREGQWHLRRSDREALLHLPSDLSGLLRERVERLGVTAAAVLTTAAVIGREFDYRTLHSAVPLPDDAVLDALEAALRAHLLIETEGGYRFRHGLIRAVLYDSLSRARRAQLHTRVAQAIETVAQRPGGIAAPVATLAHHYDLSDRRDRALDYLIQAGQQAAEVFAFEVAVDYFSRALTLMDALGLADLPQRAMMLEALGGWHSLLANTPHAVAAFEQALALQLPTRDRLRLRSGAAVALITAGSLNEAEAHLRAALAEADETHETPEYADLLYNVALVHWHRGEHHRAFDVAQKSLGIAERINRPEAIARAFEMLALACHSLGEWQRGIYYEHRRADLVGSDLDVSDAFDVHL